MGAGDRQVRFSPLHSRHDFYRGTRSPHGRGPQGSGPEQCLDHAQQAVENAIGGEDVTTAVLGRERYPVNVRYMRDFRSDLGALERVLVPAGGHRQLPLGELAEISTSRGPSMIRDENGLLTGYVYVDIAGRDPEGYIAEAGPLLRSELKMPTGYAISWSGQYEA